MKKNFKLVLALVLSIMMILGSVAALADKTSTHTITITNTDQNVSHTYSAYQVFKGNLDNATNKLSDIEWGNGVDAAGLIGALTSTSAPTSLAAIKTALGTVDTSDSAAVAAAATKVAEQLGKLTASDTANAIDDFATLVAAHLTANKSDFTESSKTYTATVTGDGYYFIKDTTTTSLTTAEGVTPAGSDTLSKYMLSVVANVTIAAKDTHLTPDKEIVEGSNRVKEGTAAVGDTVTFEVKIKVPNTKKYIDHFVFDMKDKLPVGMTFMGITSVKVGNDNVPYTLTVAEKTASGYGEFATYTAPTDAATAVTTPGGQQIKLVFNGFKAFAETEGKDYIGQDMVITYTAVVNDKADFTPTGNINEVWFDYSNDPNHDYDGDQPGPDEPMGETPHDKTKTLLINLEILKTGDNGTVTALEGAEFEITSDDYNVTLVSGEKFEETGYTAKTGETIEAGTTYYKLKVGGYTTTAPSDSTKSMYENDGTKTYVKVSYADYDVTPGSTKKVTAITGSDGKIVLKGLKPGTYKVKETKAPAGYNLDSTEYVLKVNWTYDTSNKTGTFSKDASSNAAFSDIDNTATFKITIDNNSGAQLPSTGGIGTTIFYVGGSILVLAAAILLITKRRMSNND